MKVLVLYWDNWHRPLRLAVREHLFAVRDYHPENTTVYHNARALIPDVIRRTRFNLIVIHNTFLCLRWNEQKAHFARLTEQVAALKGPKVAIPQDEYDHAHALDEFCESVGVQTIFSNFGAAHWPLLYPRMHSKAEFQTVLTGYLSDRVVRAGRALARESSRDLDVVYRASRLPYWFGQHGQLKWEVGQAALRGASRLGLRHDISWQVSKVVGKNWLSFLASSKSVVGCEGGSSLLDRRGEIREAVSRYLERYPAATYAEVRQACFPDQAEVRFAALSPRHLEACATGTVQLLVEGEYSGVLEPEKHYVAIAPDFSNLDEVLRVCHDPSRLKAIAERAFSDIADSPGLSYRGFSDRILSAAHAPSGHQVANLWDKSLLGWHRGVRQIQELCTRPVFHGAARLLDWARDRRRPHQS